MMLGWFDGFRVVRGGVRFRVDFYWGSATFGGEVWERLEGMCFFGFCDLVVVVVVVTLMAGMSGTFLWTSAVTLCLMTCFATKFLSFSGSRSFCNEGRKLCKYVAW